MSTSDKLRNSVYKGDSLSEYGFSPDEPLGAPTKKALEFLIDCAGMVAGIAGSPIPGQFYQELLRAVASADGNSEMVTSLLDLGKNKINTSREDVITISKLEDAARRSVQGKRMTPSYSTDSSSKYDFE